MKKAPPKQARLDAAAGENEQIEGPVALNGAVTQKVSQIRGASLSLTTVIGELEEGLEVIVPLVDWQLFGVDKLEHSLDDGEIGEAIGSHLVALDNMAFVVNRLARDFKDAARQLATQAYGGIRPLASRMNYSAAMLRNASDNLIAAAEHLQALYPPEAEVAFDFSTNGSISAKTPKGS